MIHNLNNSLITNLFPKQTYKQREEVVFTPFSETIIEQLVSLGGYLMEHGRSEANIVAAGYWLRKSHLESIKAQYAGHDLRAKGQVFHIAPGNVDTLFFYSIIISLLCGNHTLLRLSDRLSHEAALLIELLNQYYQQVGSAEHILSRLQLIQYPRDLEISAAISKQCDSRVIWGSDETIQALSELPLASTHANNICFPDRYSVALLQITSEAQLERASEALLRDIKPYFQQACSSPKVIYWLNTAQDMQDKFWLLLAEKLTAIDNMSAADKISQLLYLQRLPLLLSADNKHKSRCLLKNFEPLQVFEVEQLTLDSIKSHIGLWVLLSLQINKLDQVKLFEHCQTVTHFGLEEAVLENWKNTTQQPMKRLIAAGQSLAFSHIWDGIDLVKSLTE